jgi:hypothetical protein
LRSWRKYSSDSLTYPYHPSPRARPVMGLFNSSIIFIVGGYFYISSYQYLHSVFAFDLSIMDWIPVSISGIWSGGKTLGMVFFSKENIRVLPWTQEWMAALSLLKLDLMFMLKNLPVLLCRQEENNGDAQKKTWRIWS